MPDMTSKFLPQVSATILEEKKASGNDEELYEWLVEPLHVELYQRQNFDFLDDISAGQQLLLCYDYVRNQVMQGGFIQLIQNGYVSLLAYMPEWLYMVGAPEMAKLIDDVLKVYVLNHDILDAETTPEEFAKLYEEFKEFEILDDGFFSLNENTIKSILQYAMEHIGEFVTVQD
jgi:hypothetical protein